MSQSPVIHARGLTRYYGTTVGIEDLDLDVLPGEVFGFLGPNGVVSGGRGLSKLPGVITLVLVQ